MQADQAFVGTIAIGIGMMALSAALGFWSEPFRLRTILAIEDRWGRSVARATLGIVAAGMLGAGFAILLDARPSYATQQYDGGGLGSPESEEAAPHGSNARD